MKLHSILSIFFPLSLFAAHPDLVFEERNGNVAIEAEHFQSQIKHKIRSWHLVSNATTPEMKPDGDPSHAATASGGAYLEILPDTRRSHDDKLIKGENFSNEPGKLAILTYHVKFNTPGRYYCWVRTHSTNTEDNGIHLGINGTWPESGARMQWTTKNKWHWNTKQRTVKKHNGVFGKIWIDVPRAGLHQIHFSMREDGFEFDKFLLTLDKPDQENPILGFGPETRIIAGAAPRPTFPASWGEIPRIQTRDIRTLPAGYGKGSGTLANWIAVNLKKSRAARTKATAQIDTASNTETSKKRPLQEPRQPNGNASVILTGDTQWQPVTLTLDGPFAHELDHAPNPFRDYSFTVTFRHESGAPIYHVPGYFAADGSAAETSANSGTKWRAHLSPDKSGVWHYQTHFHTGKDIALHPVEKAPAKPFNALEKYDTSGTFMIAATPPDAPGFYAQGRLEYQSSNYLQFAGSGTPFLKVGADAPETLLAFADFDGTIAPKAKAPLKHFKAHLRDWKQGDPIWKKNKGKGLIGALNYLSGKGMNSFSFLPYNAGGDGDNVWPFVSRDQKFHYDCSKLDQWNIVFTHAQSKGLFLHFKLQETENDDQRLGHKAKNARVPTALDGGKLGPERMLYCREIVARFGHHLALNWNLGEENTQTTEEQFAMANYLRDVDPYDHHLVVHTYPSQQDKIYPALQGEHSPFTGASLQNSSLKEVHWQVVKWVRSSKKKGKAWGIAFDEPGNAGHGMPADPDYPGMPSIDEGYTGETIHDCRKYTLWGCLMAGGWGVEYYFGYKLPQNDLICEDWRSRDLSWTYAKVALDFFSDNNIPVQEMEPKPELVGNTKHDNSAYCLAQKGLYLVFLPEGGTKKLTPLKGDNPKTIQWFNSRNGQMGKVQEFKNNTLTAPDNNDWLAIIK